ncbi:PqqD family protein [Saccharicrinis aurantiacus]|uniref:PqqD family protein n=1 Tax=Saccharicrinis aurantiacus TaxID=1849719 RepID=UPI00248F8A15|nr:PqqD family protein [Saccharicrinis aurantiacus]
MNKINLNVVYKKSIDFVEKQIGNETVLVPISDNIADMNKVFTLNEVGTFIYSKINNKNSVSDILSALTEEYEVNAMIAQNDMEQFISHAISKGVIL